LQNTLGDVSNKAFID